MSDDTCVPRGFLTFLTELAANNDKDWFAANKMRYERDVGA